MVTQTQSDHIGEHPDRLAVGRARGRGAQLNPPNRFEPVTLSVLGEHLDEVAAASPDGVQVPTRVLKDHARTLINRVDVPDLQFHWTINPYRGCEHGCIYCYARPTHETFGLSCGTDFETQVFAKMDAPALLRRELARTSWEGEPIVLSGVTDAYQPIERSLQITRGCLEVMAECGQPVSIVTKNRLITRDIDLLGPLAEQGAAHVALSVTTLDAKLAAKMEPRASSPRDRLAAIRELSDAGIPVRVMVAPVIPGLTDVEVPRILEAAAEAGASAAAYVILRLPWQVKRLFLDWLAREYPERAAKIESQVRETRGGELYDSTPGIRQRGMGAVAEQIAAMFAVYRRRFALAAEPVALSSASFTRPAPADMPGQTLLFGGSR
jgi:DNA repair photolyase